MMIRELSLSAAIRSIVILILILSSPVKAETVDVKYRGPIDLKSFTCTTIYSSSLVQRVCYDEIHSYMLINLNGTWYHYCAIDKRTIESLLNATSKGQYYNSMIKGAFDCRINPIPQY